MRSFFPFILIFLALFVAACIAYIAWELSSDAPSTTKAAAVEDEH